MSLASTSAVGLAYMEEVTYGVIPVAGNPQALRITGEDLAFDFTSESSKEISNTRRTPDSILTNASASGGFNFELSYGSYDDFFEALMSSTFGAWGTAGAKSLTVTFNTGANTITDDGIDGFALLPSTPFWISIAAAATAGNNGVFLVKSRTNDVLTLSSLTPLVASDVADVVTVSSMRLSEGAAAQRSFCIEKNFSDVSQFFMHTGRVPSKLDLSFSTGSIVTGTLGFIGANAPRADATMFPGTLQAPTSTSAMNAVTGVGVISLMKNDTSTQLVSDTFVQSMKVSIDGSLREQKAIGYLGAVGVGVGTFKMSGSVEIYLKSGAIYDAALAQTLLSLTFPVSDAAGNGYAFTFDNVKLKVPKIVAGSMDADVILSCEFTAVAPNTATNRMLHIDRFGAALA